MRKFPIRARMSFCHGALRGAPSSANFPPLGKQEPRSVGLACRMTRRRGIWRAFSSTVDQNRQFSSDRVLAMAGPLPRCIPWDIAMIDEISPTATALFLKRRARPLTRALGCKPTPRRRAEGLEGDRRVRPPLQRARAASLTDMRLLTPICGAYLDVPGTRMRTGSCVASSPGRNPLAHEQASGLWSAKRMLDSWAMPIKMASVPALHWKSAPCRSSLDALRSQ